MRKLLNHNIKAGIIITALILILIFVSIFWTPYDPDAMSSAKLQGLSLSHPFGTDNFGRDILSRVLEGAGSTLLIAALTVAIGVVFGTLAGGLTGYYGGWIDEILMRINDVITAFPSILLALVLISLTGPGKYNVILALGILFIPSFARIVRSEVVKCRSLDYVKSAKLMGISDMRILFVHILPNAFPVMLSSIAIGFNNAVLAEASMSFLGIGVMPPDASLGRMLYEAQTYLFSAPWYAVSAGVMIILLILGFSLIGYGLEAANDA